jgi:hypothetical protein
MPIETNQAWMQDILDNHYEEALARANFFLAETPQDPATGCLITPTQTPRKVRYRDHQVSVYRLVYCLAKRIALPYHVVIRHRCHNRCCINPAHLIEGSRRDNKHDDWDCAAYGVNYALLPRD